MRIRQTTFGKLIGGWRLSALVGMGALLGTLEAQAAPDDEPTETTTPTVQTEGAPEPSEPTKVKRRLKVRGRIHAGYELSRKEGRGDDEGRTDLENSFLIERARLKMSWEPYEWLRGVLQLGVEQRLELGSSLLRDAYIHLAPLPQLELRVGQFKKPFSGLELMSPAKLKINDRGLGNDLLIGDLLYGGRDLGAQLSGRLIKAVKLDYAVGVFNGSGPDIADPGMSKDVAARLKVRPLDALSIGVSGSMKLYDDTVSGQPRRGYALGGDAKLSLLGMVLYVEATVAEHTLAWRDADEDKGERSPLVFDVLGVLSYQHRFHVDDLFLAVEPAFQYELLDPHSVIVDDQVSLFTPGVNLTLGKYLRIMIHGQFQRAARNGQRAYPDSETLVVLACLDI